MSNALLNWHVPAIQLANIMPNDEPIPIAVGSGWPLRWFSRAPQFPALTGVVNTVPSVNPVLTIRFCLVWWRASYVNYILAIQQATIQAILSALKRRNQAYIQAITSARQIADNNASNSLINRSKITLSILLRKTTANGFCCLLGGLPIFLWTNRYISAI